MNQKISMQYSVSKLKSGDGKMLTPREFQQIEIAIFAMAKTRINGRPVIDHEYVHALLKSYTIGDLVVVPSGDDSLDISFTPAEEKQ